MDNLHGDWKGSFARTTGDSRGIHARRRILSDGFIAALLEVTRRAPSRCHGDADSADRRGGKF